jgi:hypothetical protein
MIRRVDERIVGQRVKQFLFRSSPQTRLSFGNCFVCPETPKLPKQDFHLEIVSSVPKLPELPEGFVNFHDPVEGVDPPYDGQGLSLGE